MLRALIWFHRYLGIAIGFVMAMWCASGVVMMYVGYPSLDRAQRLDALPPIDWKTCCAYERIARALGVEAIEGFSMEMVGDRPVLTIAQSRGVRRSFDLATGATIERFDREEALAVAAHYAQKPRYQEELVRDQWTVSGEFNRDRPLHHIALNDDAGTELYISSTTGSVVQLTTRSERFWNWLGAVPHWLYPTLLRQHGALWSQVVIWLSLAGIFLTVMGLYIGIAQWLAMKGPRHSPYRGAHLWHHIGGLFFGILTLTWVFSGFASMSPWGLFEGGSARSEREAVRDLWVDGAQLVNTLKVFSMSPATSYSTRLESAPFDGKLYVVAYQGANATRFDAKTGAPAPLQASDVERVAARISDGNRTEVAFLKTGDNYYYPGHDPVELPVFRIEVHDADHSRLYLHATSGELLGKVDAGARQYRWLFEALHRLDFSAALRQRPWWDILMLPLILGVTTVTFTGVYIGLKRLAPRRKN